MVNYIVQNSQPVNELACVIHCFGVPTCISSEYPFKKQRINERRLRIAVRVTQRKDLVTLPGRAGCLDLEFTKARIRFRINFDIVVASSVRTGFVYPSVTGCEYENQLERGGVMQSGSSDFTFVNERRTG